MSYLELNRLKRRVYKLINNKYAVDEIDITAFLIAHKEFKTLENMEYKVVLDFCGFTKSLY